MEKAQIYEKLNDVFRDVFDDEELVIDENTTADDVEDWDSLEHINLMVAVETAFDIKFNMGEVNSFKNVGAMVESIKSKVD